MVKHLIIGSIITALLAAAFPFTSTFTQGLVILTLLTAYWSTSWNLLGGLAGQVGFGHALFIGIGAYASSLLYVQLHVSPWLGMWVGAAISVAVAAAIGFVSFRYGLRGVFFSLVTLAFSLVAMVLVLNTSYEGPFGGSRGIAFPVEAPGFWRFQFESRLGYLVVISLFLITAVLLTEWIRHSSLGYYVVATRENELGAQAVGVNTRLAKLVAFCLSAGLTALGGTFYAQYYFFIDPPSVFGMAVSTQIILPAVVGGMNTTLGPLVGALVTVPLAEVARRMLGGGANSGHQIVYGAVLLLVVLFAPGGLMGLAERLWRTRGKAPHRVAGKQPWAKTPAQPAAARERGNADGTAGD